MTKDLSMINLGLVATAITGAAMALTQAPVTSGPSCQSEHFFAAVGVVPLGSSRAPECDRPYLVLVPSSRCPATSEIMAEWRALASELDPSGEHLLALGPDDEDPAALEQLLREHGIRARAGVMTSWEVFEEWTGVDAVPATLVVDHHGRVTYAEASTVWTMDEDAIRAAFHRAHTQAAR
jgi:hypothetical protein